MTNLSFAELDRFFRNNNFPGIENDLRGIRFLKLRSMSRRETLEHFINLHNLNPEVSAKDYFEFVFNNENILDQHIDEFIRSKYVEERAGRVAHENYLVDQLNRLQYFDWGGSFGNSLEKNIVDNYVKRIQSYDRINEEIEGSLLSSLRGYTLNSWYNHWTSIIIEDIFKDHNTVLPTVGLVKKIDFFINNIPFDLKVTYFPEQLLAVKLRQNGFGNELTKIKQICRRLNIYIPADLKDKALKIHLLNVLSEDPRIEARNFILELREEKRRIISEAEENPSELKRWFYENQGEARFDASNRFFLVLTDENDLTNSWRLKRNVIFLRQNIHEHLNQLAINMESLDTEFYWARDRRTYTCKSDILFLTFSDQ